MWTFGVPSRAEVVDEAIGGQIRADMTLGKGDLERRGHRRRRSALRRLQLPGGVDIGRDFTVRSP
jgi:hypothetical protein